MGEIIFRSLLVCLVGSSFFLISVSLIAQDVDTDGDGLSDFHETYKYLSDPNNPDSDGDGIRDGDWLERREHQYTIRSVIQVMRPVTPEFLNDDYQDARVLDETEKYVELEVIHYPFNQIGEAISTDETWREHVPNDMDLQEWIEPGPASNWTPELANQIEDDLKKDGINLEELDDRQTVEIVSKWLLDRTEHHDGFTMFITAFDEDGNPYLPEEHEHKPGIDERFTVQEQWDRELLCAEMYRNRMRGSCSSSSVYLSGCLRAIGMPTRTVLCVPLIDANDDAELKMLNQIKNRVVRSYLKSSLSRLKGSWASHSFNEVYVGGRWVRLNYDNLGQGIYDRNLFGMITHVATFRDWSDAKMHETIGARDTLPEEDNVFHSPNPYSTISLRDDVGVHCQVEVPEFKEQQLIVDKIWWTDSDELPEDIRKNCERKGRYGLIAKVTGFADRATVPEFLANADARVVLQPDGFEPDSPQIIGIGFDQGCYWLYEDHLMIYLPFGQSDKEHFEDNKPYVFTPRNDAEGFQWISKTLTIVRED